MRAARALLAALLLLVPAACDDGGDLPEDAVFCLLPAHCANVSIEGGECCSGVCVDCFTDSDGDGTSDCADPDYLDGICAAD
jgi:hypothetical protein